MNRIATTLAALLAATTLALAAQPAQAAPRPVPCTSAEMSLAEYQSLTQGLTLAQVETIVGSKGTFSASESKGIRMVYRWTFCESSWRTSQRLTFLAPNKFSTVPQLMTIHGLGD